MNLDVRNISIKEVLWKIKCLQVHWKRIFSYESPDNPPRSHQGHCLFLCVVYMNLDAKIDMYEH